MKKLTEVVKASLDDAQFSPSIMLHFTPGIWVNEKCYWLQDCREKIIYEEKLTLKVMEEQIHSKIKLFHLYVRNHSSQDKRIKILGMHYHPRFLKDHFAFISPADHLIFHFFSNKHIYLVNGQNHGTGMKEYTIQPFWHVFTGQIWSSLDKGTLEFQPIMKGMVSSIFTLEELIRANTSAKFNTWMIIGQTKAELVSFDWVLKKHTGNSI